HDAHPCGRSPPPHGVGLRAREQAQVELEPHAVVAAGEVEGARVERIAYAARHALARAVAHHRAAERRIERNARRARAQAAHRHDAPAAARDDPRRSPRTVASATPSAIRPAPNSDHPLTDPPSPSTPAASPTSGWTNTKIAIVPALTSRSARFHANEETAVARSASSTTQPNAGRACSRSNGSASASGTSGSHDSAPARIAIWSGSWRSSSGFAASV